MVQQPAPRDKQAVYQDGYAKRAFEHGATVTLWSDDYAENLLARFWPNQCALDNRRMSLLSCRHAGSTS